jgi:hypothetical protein
MEFLISGFLVMFAPPQSIDKTTLFVVTAWAFLVIAIAVFPLLYVWLLTKSLNDLKSTKFLKTWGGMLENLRRHEKVFYFHPLFFIVHRLLFVLTAFYLRQVPALQIMTINYLNLASLIYFGLYLPLEGRANNYVELYNLSMTSFLNSCIFAFTEFVPDQLT